MKELEKKYLEAKRTYYSGTPIMTDSEFDELEAYLKNKKSKVIDIVGYNDDRNAKYYHPSPMLSLSKYQTKNDLLPLAEINAWMDKNGEEVYEASPKFDGNAINIIYKKGSLFGIFSRGDGQKGRDYTTKLKHLVPATINSTVDIVEIRGEVLISLEDFFNHYAATNKNERNFVAGILNRDSLDMDILNQLVIMPLDIKIHNNNDFEFGNLKKCIKEWNFSTPEIFKIDFNKNDFEDTYYKMVEYRKNCKFRLDGFVVKVLDTNSKKRKQLGETSKDPNWAVAIKFEPKAAQTTIIDISWKMGKYGILNPTADLEPVSLDGTVVKSANLYNYKFIKTEKLFPGAKVIIKKAGDIVPFISEILEKSEENNNNWYPKNCPECNSTLIEEGVNLVCDNKNCGHLHFNNFKHSMDTLEIFGISDAMYKKLWNAGIRNCLDIFNPEIFNTDNLVSTGEFKRGKTLTNLIENVKVKKSIDLSTLVRILNFKGVGQTTSEEIAKKIAGIDYSFIGLEKEVVNGFDKGEEKRKIVEDAIEKLKNSTIEIKYPEDIKKDKNVKVVELTGSPKKFGFKTKKEFLDAIKNKGFVYGKLKDADILVTDDFSKTSNKMEKAKKKGIEIKLYSDF